jgi:hypothetical protein
MFGRLLYISVVFAALALLVPDGVFASHGHEFPEDWQNPCDVIPCEPESTGGSAEESASHEGADENARENAEEGTTDESAEEQKEESIDNR